MVGSGNFKPRHYKRRVHPADVNPSSCLETMSRFRCGTKQFGVCRVCLQPLSLAQCATHGIRH